MISNILQEQAIYDSNASVKAIMAAKALFYNETNRLPVSYPTTPSKMFKVQDELTRFGLVSNYERRNQFFFAQGKCVKKVKLIGLMNKYV